MNAATLIYSTLVKYQLHPIEEYYLVIVDAMQKYQSNPPDIFINGMNDARYKSECENSTIYKK